MIIGDLFYNLYHMHLYKKAFYCPAIFSCAGNFSEVKLRLKCTFSNHRSITCSHDTDMALAYSSKQTSLRRDGDNLQIFSLLFPICQGKSFFMSRTIYVSIGKLRRQSHKQYFLLSLVEYVLVCMQEQLQEP